MTFRNGFSRYPAGADNINENDMKTALKNAHEIFEFTKARIIELTGDNEKVEKQALDE